MSDALVVRDLFVNYGRIEAVRGISLRVPEGGIVAVLGPNGAGKSSTLNAICGNSAGTVRGEVELLGTSIAGEPAHAIAQKGLVMVPEGRQILAPLTVEENLLLGSYPRALRKGERQRLAEVYEMFPILYERRSGLGGLLSGGEQQMLAFGRAMMANPSIIVMDEPSMGLAPVIVDRVMDAIREINRRGTSILLVEQNAAASLAVADTAYVVDQGRVVLHGPAAELRGNEMVARSFLGLHDDLDGTEPVGIERVER